MGHTFIGNICMPHIYGLLSFYYESSPAEYLRQQGRYPLPVVVPTISEGSSNQITPPPPRTQIQAHLKRLTGLSDLSHHSVSIWVMPISVELCDIIIREMILHSLSQRNDQWRTNLGYLLTECPLTVHPSWVPASSPSRGGDVAVYVSDINQPSLPTHFFIFYSALVSVSVYTPFQLYFIP